MSVLQFPARTKPNIESAEPAHRNTPFEMQQLLRARILSGHAGYDLTLMHFRAEQGASLESEPSLRDGRLLRQILQAALHVLNLMGARNCDRPLRAAICAWLNDGGMGNA